MPLDPQVEAARKKIEQWKADPALWFREVLGGPQPWSRQKDILDALPRFSEIDVVSGNSVGKDWLISRVVLWWISTRQGIVISSGPTQEHVNTVLWGELRDAYQNSRIPLGGDLLPKASRLNISPKHYAIGVVGRDVGSLSGFHAPTVLLILDEAAELSSHTFEALESCVSTDDSLIIRIGNPLSGPSHPFTKSCSRPTVEGEHTTIHISSLESPNVVEGRDVVPGLASRRFVKRWADKHGEDSNAYRMHILGKFAAGAADSLITMDHIGEAKARFNDEVGNPKAEEVRIGCDVARQGDDMTEICVRRGNRIYWPEGGRLAKADGVKVAQRLALIANDYGAMSIAIDGGGLGAGPIDALRDMQNRGEFSRDVEVIEVQFGAAAKDKTRYSNIRSELWWSMREWIRDEAVFGADDARFDDLVDELTAPSYKHVGARIQLEPKDGIKKRLKHSTDMSDALALAISGEIYSEPVPFIMVL